MITLSHTGTAVELTQFRATATLPRRAQADSTVQTNYSYAGNDYPSGRRRTVYEWQFTALVTEEQKRLLNLVWAKSEAAARTPPYTGSQVRLLDQTQPVTEATQTRSADGAVTNNPDGSVTYYPRWDARFAALDFELVGRTWWAVVSLKEGDAIAP